MTRLGRAILTDPARFRTVGPGTHGELLDPAIGPDALLNMDGPAHEALDGRSGTLSPPRRAGPWRAAAGADRGHRAAAARRRTGRSGPGRAGRHRAHDVRAARGPVAAGWRRGYLEAYRQGEELVGMTVQAIRRGIRPEELDAARILVDRLGAPGRAGWAAGEGTIGGCASSARWEGGARRRDHPGRDRDRQLGRAPFAAMLS